MDDAIKVLTEFRDSLPFGHKDWPGLDRAVEVLKLANRRPDPGLDPNKVGQLPDLRMDAYYYGFDRTGALPIDRILSAVATAGKMYHHTEYWNEEDPAPSPRDRIQNAANEAATAWRANRKPDDGP